MKIIFEKGKVKELDDMISKHFTMEGPVFYGAVLTEEEMEMEKQRWAQNGTKITLRRTCSLRWRLVIMSVLGREVNFMVLHPVHDLAFWL
jgi:hypothetical protein